MLIRYLVLACLCIVGALYRVLTPRAHPPSISPLEIARLLREGDGESVLALGAPLELRRASIYDLERISGISDRIAGRIVAHKGEILAQARVLPEDKKWLALTIIHGIGPKTARVLGRSIDVEN